VEEFRKQMLQNEKNQLKVLNILKMEIKEEDIKPTIKELKKASFSDFNEAIKEYTESD